MEHVNAFENIKDSANQNIGGVLVIIVVDVPSCDMGGQGSIP